MTTKQSLQYNLAMGLDHEPAKLLPKADRIKLAKETLNRTIPSLLAAIPRARAGVNSSQLLRDLPCSNTPETAAAPVVRVTSLDTFEAARTIHSIHPSDRVVVLSMASPLRPGGGLLTGATSQEESLCMRSTLFPSLKDSFYRLPEDAIIYTSDVLVFRLQDLSPLPKTDRFFVDIISCPAIRFPDVCDNKYVANVDREVMMKKIRLIMRAVMTKGCKRVVLGALGCGAYANPVKEVAEMFKKVICGNGKRTREEMWGGIEEIVFAIKGPDNVLTTFREVFRESDRDATESRHGEN
jgi:uncharacterized protein (TIGR02452 family)